MVGRKIRSSRRRQDTARFRPQALVTMEPARTILIIDDDVDVARLVATVLRRKGFLTIEACNVSAVLSICKNAAQPIDLVLSDFEMPVMNGLQLAERILELRPGIATVFMSGNHTICDSIRRGGLPCLAKPFSLEKLVGMVQDSLLPR